MTNKGQFKVQPKFGSKMIEELPISVRCTTKLKGGLCPNPKVTGRSICKQCIYKAKLTKKTIMGMADKYSITPTQPLPAWMNDPSLLPKRPPGMR